MLRSSYIKLAALSETLPFKRAICLDELLKYKTSHLLSNRTLSCFAHAHRRCSFRKHDWDKSATGQVMMVGQNESGGGRANTDDANFYYWSLLFGCRVQIACFMIKNLLLCPFCIMITFTRLPFCVHCYAAHDLAPPSSNQQNQPGKTLLGTYKPDLGWR